MVPSDTEEDNSEDEASSATNAQPAQEAPTVAKTPSLINNEMPAVGEAAGNLGLQISAVWSAFGETPLVEPKQKK